MQSKKVATAVCTAVSGGSANIQAAKRLAFQGRASAPNMVRTESAQSMGAPETTTAEEEVFVGTTTLKWPALLKVVATKHTYEDFVRHMLERRPALLKGAIQLFKLVDSARSMVPLGSAITSAAPLLQHRSQKEGVVCTAVAGPKCAR